MSINTPISDAGNKKFNALQSVDYATSEDIGKIFGQEHTITSYLWENVDKETFISAIKSAIESIKQEEIYASWSEWEIYRINIADTKGNVRELLVAKKRFDNNPDNEYSLHERIWKLVQEWDAVQVPKLWWKFSHKGDNYIVMDFIRWKTLYHKIAEWIIEKKAKEMEASATWKTEIEKNIAYQQASNLRNRINSAKSDSDVEHIFLEWYEYDSKKTDEAFYRERGTVKIFWNDEWEKYRDELRDFIKKMHENWFYHRDLHEKNIIFGDDGKIYVIDFGKSIYFDPKKWKPSKKNIYEEQMWEMIWSYSEDEDIIWQIKWLTKQKQDEENENFVRQAKEESKKLMEGAKIIEAIDFAKIKNKKIKNMIVKYFWWFEQFKKEVDKEEKSGYTINSFLDVSDSDLVLSLFSITGENLKYLLETNIYDSKKKQIDWIKKIRYPKLWKEAWESLFGNDDNIDEKFLYEVLNKMWNQKGYQEIYNGKNLNFLGELKPMLDIAKKLVKIKEIQWYLESIRNAAE